MLARRTLRVDQLLKRSSEKKSTPALVADIEALALSELKRLAADEVTMARLIQAWSKFNTQTLDKVRRRQRLRRMHPNQGIAHGLECHTVLQPSSGGYRRIYIINQHKTERRHEVNVKRHTIKLFRYTSAGWGGCPHGNGTLG